MESPAKKISYWVDSIVTCLLECCENTTQLAEKYTLEALQLNAASAKRKYYLLAILHPFLPTEFIVKNDPNLIAELFIACGDFYTLPAPALLVKILTDLYNKNCSTDLTSWRSYWEHHYFTCLQSSSLAVIKGIITTVNPILAKINKNSVLYMLSAVRQTSNIKADIYFQVLDSKATTTVSKKNALWIFVSFLKVAREKSLIKEGIEGSFSLSGTSIVIDQQRIKKLILNKDRNIIINILDFIS